MLFCLHDLSPLLSLRRECSSGYTTLKVTTPFLKKKKNQKQKCVNKIKTKIRHYLNHIFCYLPCPAIKPCCNLNGSTEHYMCVFTVCHKHGFLFWALPQDFTQTAGFKWASICGSLFTDSEVH